MLGGIGWLDHVQDIDTWNVDLVFPPSHVDLFCQLQAQKFKAMVRYESN
jgi:hypothetical protein